MLRKIFGIDNGMDEMLQAKQNKAAANAFLLIVIGLSVVICAKAAIFSMGFWSYATEMFLLVLGFGYYTYQIVRGNIPFVPSRVPVFVVFCVSAILGILVGVRNVFFLYAHNTNAQPLLQRVLTAGFIAVIVMVEGLIIGAGSIFVLKRLAVWQNKRIEKQIEQENEENTI